MKCKNCKKEIEIQISGLKHFCSYDCKKAYRQAYKAKWIKQKRHVDTGGGYIDINLPLVDSANPLFSSLPEGKNGSPRHFNYERFGGLKWYQFIKNNCCNFDVKQKENYCVTLAEPYQTFRATCSECLYLGQSLVIKNQIQGGK